MNLEGPFVMTEDTLHQDRKPIIEADLGENGGRIEFASILDAREWIKAELLAWRNFNANLASRQDPMDVMGRQLALPSNIAERLDQAISLEGDELSQVISEISVLFEKYADYHSLYSESNLGIAIRNTISQPSQRAAVGGLACSIGIPAHEFLTVPGKDPNLLSDVLSGYALGRELNVVKRSEISSHEQRMDKYIDSFRRIVADANASNEVSKEEKTRLLADMVQEAERQKNSWEGFHESANNEWQKLRTAFDNQLRLEAPAHYWAKEAKRTLEAATGALILFVVIASLFIAVLIFQGPSFLAELVQIGPRAAYASIALISIPALTALWVLRHVARLFVTNFERSNDAKMRETMATTFLALTKEGASSAEENERLLVLEALFRPLGPKQADDGHFGGALEILTRRDG